MLKEVKVIMEGDGFNSVTFDFIFGNSENQGPTQVFSGQAHAATHEFFAVRLFLRIFCSQTLFCAQTLIINPRRAFA